MRIRTLIILIAILLIIGVVGILAIFYLASGGVKPPAPINTSITFSVLNSGVLDYGSSVPSKVVYLLTQADGQGIADANVSVMLYDSEIPHDIYLLDYSSPGFSGCTECDGLPDFRTSLEATLKKYDLLAVNSTLNQIKIDQLERISRPSILIVPTGKIPAQLIGLETGQDLNQLMDKGFVIIFLGSDLDEALYTNGSVVSIPDSTLSAYNISYQVRSDLETCQGYTLQNPSFVISRNNIAACSMSYVQRGNGYFFVLPRSIDIGWSNGKAAGEDVGRLIHEVLWKEPLTTGGLDISAQEINESNSSSSMIFLAPSQYDSGWARIFVNATTSNGTQLYKNIDTEITNPVNGEMTNKPQAFGNEKMLIEFRFSENFSTTRDANISVAVYKNMQYVWRQYAHSIKIQTEYTFTSNFIVDPEYMPVGNYTLRAEDDNGYVYAQSFLSVPPIILTMPNPRWDLEPQIFTFFVSVPRNPILSNSSDTVPLPYTLAYITVNKTPGHDLLPPYSNASDSNGAFTFIPSQSLDYGLYTFKVNISGQSLTINSNFPKPASWLDNPLNIVLIVAIVLVAALAIALRRPEKPVYTIDVPDFPPLERVVVPISKFSVISLFDSVNKEYKWSFMPLSPQELKNEMRRKITYKGAPILITDYNLDKILDELIESGDVVKALNFYGLKSWEAKSGRSIRYLVLFRLLRNFLINNAIPFTDLNQRKDCDMLATVKGEGLYLHIYTDDGTLKRALELSGAGKNFIVFESRKELEEILKKLDLSYSSLAVILKSEIGVGSIQLIHPGNFGAILGR